MKPARSDRVHDRYGAGLHHLAWHAAGRDDVDRLYRLLLAMGARILDAPADYPRAGQHVRWRYRHGMFRVLHDRPLEVRREVAFAAGVFLFKRYSINFLFG